MHVRRLLPALLVSLTLVGSSGHAWAAPDDADAEALIGRGIELREKGHDDEALGLFKQALVKAPSPRARAQVALAEQALGMWVPAEADLVAALGQPDDPWITKNRAALEGALAAIRRRLGTLEVRGTAGASVSLDGVSLGTLPSDVPFRVEAGRRTLELRAKGFYPTTRSIEVPAGGIARESMTLVAIPPDAGGNEPAGERRPRSDGVTSEDPGRSQRLVGWIVTGAGGALLATGGLGFLVRKGIIDDYNAQCPGRGAADQPVSCQDKEDATNTWLYVGVGSLIAGGLLTIGGLTLVATAPRRDARAASSVQGSCGPRALAAGGGLFCSGSF